MLYNIYVYVECVCLYDQSLDRRRMNQFSAFKRA